MDALNGGPHSTVCMLESDRRAAGPPSRPPRGPADFAILLEAGFTWRKALLWNLVSAITAYLGFIVGVAAVSSLVGQVWVLAFTAGMFLYIALTDLVRARARAARS